MNNPAMQYESSEYMSRDKLFEDHLPLVKIIAHHISVRLPPDKCVEDLIQVGMIGLLEAARTYEPNQGAEFKSYASIRIRGAILDELRRETWVPRSVQQKSRRLSRAIQEVENRKGCTATDKEIAKELGLSMEEYAELLETVASCTVFSLDDDNTFSEPATDEDETMMGLHDESVKKTLASAIGQLPEQEKMVVVLYYDYGMNLREIGEVLNVSESRVCQIHSQATARLRTKMRSNMIEEDDL
ncbi:MAG: RNA polymerase sigma factor FliA [Pseudomonadales bacterium]|nr:RNA polymerase sigma factor FliA [Pseudomonadales bacterium]